MKSYKLLSEVSDIEIAGDTAEIRNIQISNNLLYFDYWYEDKESQTATEIKKYSINIHELAYKCKEWALKQGYYSIASGISYEGINDTISKNKECFCSTQIKRGVLPIYYKAETEPEAIFKACQWILDNKDK